MRFGAAHLSDEDLTAVISFLRAQPALKNPVPAPEWKLMGKLMLPMFPVGPAKRGCAAIF